MKSKVIEAIEKEKIVVIVRGVAKEKLIPLCEAMYKGGIRLLELTFDASKKISDSETAENIKMIAENFSGRMFIGAGTVMEESQVELTKNVGGSFIISPNTDKAVIKRTAELEMVSMPGALTPSEIKLAHDYGADFVKLFPADSFGPGYVKAVKAPLSHIKIIAVGGVNVENIEAYLKAGASGFGIGTNIVDKELINNGRYDEITVLARKYVEAVNK